MSIFSSLRDLMTLTSVFRTDFFWRPFEWPGPFSSEAPCDCDPPIISYMSRIWGPIGAVYRRRTFLPDGSFPNITFSLLMSSILFLIDSFSIFLISNTLDAMFCTVVFNTFLEGILDWTLLPSLFDSLDVLFFLCWSS